jgi:HEPN domain-containing protein
MNDDSHIWASYAEENLEVAAMALEGEYFNACLQNVQQSVEKFIKAALMFKGEPFPKTHNIETLNQQLQKIGVDTGLSNEDCELLDTIYLPSKYPFGSALPDFAPDKDLAQKCVDIARRTQQKMNKLFFAT